MIAEENLTRCLQLLLQQNREGVVTDSSLVLERKPLPDGKYSPQVYGTLTWTIDPEKGA